MPGLGDHERRPGAHDLAGSRGGSPRRGADRRRRRRARRARSDGSTSRERDDPPLDLRDGLLRDDDDVARLEPAGTLGRSRRAAGRGRRPPRARECPARPITRTSAAASITTERRSVEAGDASPRAPCSACSRSRSRPSCPRALARSRAGRRRPRVPTVIRSASSSTSALAVGVVAADERVLVRRVLAAEIRRGERVQAGDDRRRRASSWIRCGDRRRLGRREDALLREARARRRPRAPASSRSPRAASRAVSTAPSAFVVRTTRSARARGVLVRRALDAELGGGRPRALGVARADHDVVPGLAEADGERQSRSSRCLRSARPSRATSSAASSVDLGEPAGGLAVAHQRIR